MINIPSEIIYLETTGREMRKQLFWDFDQTDEHSRRKAMDLGILARVGC